MMKNNIYRFNAFDFGVITYNQQDVIIETLESIKYLIVQYGTGLDIRLIIGDDGSKDRTVEMCEKWLEINKGLFKEYTVIIAKKNEGTVVNYLKVLESIKSPYFKIMDGDDIFTNKNLFELYNQIKDNEIFTCIPIAIDEYGQYRDATNDYWYFFEINDNKRYKIMKYQNIFLSGSTFIKKEMIKESTIDFMKQFCLLEDHSMYYEIMMREKPIIKYSGIPYIIYRVRKTSVSHNRTLNEVYAKDCAKMNKIMLKNASDIYSRIHLAIAFFSYKTRYIYCQPIKYWAKILVLIRKKKIKQRDNKLLQSDILEAINHFNYIRDSAKKFLTIS